MFQQKVILEYKNEVKNLFVKDEDNILSFNTFFNSLNLYLIKHYTDGKNLTIEIDYSGDASVKVVYKFKDQERVLFDSDHLQKQITINIEDLPEEGIIFPVFRGNFDLKAMTFSVDATSRKVTTSVIFTTFNRQEFLFPNLRKLNSCRFVDHVVIVDNARNVNLPSDLPNSKFIVVPNDNLGGSGGFTRGMMKAKEIGDSHMFIMDDDITLLPEVVDKALSLISCLKAGHELDWLGFSMLPNGKPNVQFELGSKWNGVKMDINNLLLDVSVEENLWKNQINKKYNYSAWWSLIMPVSVIDRYGYPLPFFIKFDDIEYGLRRQQEEIILTNGFGVWHEDFDKKYNAYLEYYLFRNSLVTNALHIKFSLLRSLHRYLIKNLKYYLKNYRIEMTLINIALNDFLKGPDYFLTLDIEKRNTEIREIAKKKVGFFRFRIVNPFIVLGYSFKLLFAFSPAKRKYKKNLAKLISKEQWESIFKLDKNNRN